MERLGITKIKKTKDEMFVEMRNEIYFMGARSFMFCQFSPKTGAFMIKMTDKSVIGGIGMELDLEQMKQLVESMTETIHCIENPIEGPKRPAE